MEQNTNITLVGADSVPAEAGIHTSGLSHTVSTQEQAPTSHTSLESNNKDEQLLPVLEPASKLHTQAVDTWAIAIGGENNDFGDLAQETTDGGFVVAGLTSNFEAEFHDIFLGKTDNKGNLLWARAFGRGDYERVQSVQETTDGGFVVAGYTQSSGVGHRYIFLVKTDSGGTLLWAKSFGEGDYNCVELAQETTDGGFIVTGKGTFGAGTAAFLGKMDNIGNLLWLRALEGGDSEGGNSVQETTDGGFIVVGFNNNSAAWKGYTFLAKTDSEGTLLWAKVIGGGEYDYGKSVQETTDGGFVVAGYTESFGAVNGDIFLVKTDSGGTLLWAKAIGERYDDYGKSVQETTDGGFVVVGYTHSFGAGDADIFLAKTDSEGTLLWAKAIGGGDTDFGDSVQETTDGGFVVAGRTENFGAGDSDIFLGKLDSNGNCKGCSMMQDITSQVIVKDVTGVITVTNISPTVTNVSPTVTDIAGQFIVRDISPTRTEICMCPSNLDPIVINSIPDQTLNIRGTTPFQFNSNTFSDSDGDTLSYTATLSNDAPLPGWITFNPGPRTFNFNPTSSNLGAISIKVTANDGYGGIVSYVFDVTVLNRTPTPVPVDTHATDNNGWVIPVVVSSLCLACISSVITAVTIYKYKKRMTNRVPAGYEEPLEDMTERLS